MPLLPPTVAPLSTASRSVYVSGILDGAAVEVFMEGVPAPIVTATPGRPDARLTIAAGVLIAGRGVWATQQTGADTSDPPSKNENQIVQGVPNPLGPPSFGVTPFACGMAARVDNVFCGAEAAFQDSTGPDGTAEEDGNSARVTLVRVVALGAQLRASQSAGGVTSAHTTCAPAGAPPTLPGGKLPPPTFGQPPAECDPAILIQNIIPGSLVTVTRPSGPEFALSADTQMWLFLSKPLKQNEPLMLRQEVSPRCKLAGVDGPVTAAGPATPVPVPSVSEPLCAGTERLVVSNLIPFAKLVLSYNGTTWETRAGGEPSKEITLSPPLAFGPVTAIQERCGHESDPSVAVLVDPAPDHVDPPFLPGPVFGCAQAVRIEKIHPGAKVRLTVTGLNGAVRLTEKIVSLDWCDMPVVSLIKGEKLFAEQFGCGIWSDHSNDAMATDAPPVGLPSIRPDLHDYLTVVPVIDVVPGARVHVYVDDVWAGSATTGSTEAFVPIGAPLVVNQKVKAWQHLCFSEGKPNFGPEMTPAPVVTVVQPGDTSKATPYTIVIVANPALETSRDSGVFLIDPIMADRATFDTVLTYITDVLFGKLASQAEQLLADPAIQPRIRILRIFQPDLPANATNALVDHYDPNIIEPRRDEITAFMAAHNIAADLVYAVTASTTHSRASAWGTTDDASRGGVDLKIDGSPFSHRFFCTTPGTVALHVTSNSMTALHEFGHAASSYLNGFVTDQYVDSPPNLNIKTGRPIPNAFGTLDATGYDSDLTRDGLGYETGWVSYHPALTATDVPSLMDNFWMAPAPKHPEACVFDTITRQFLRDRLLAKLSRP